MLPNPVGLPIFAEEFGPSGAGYATGAPFSFWDPHQAPNGVWRTDYGYGGMGDYKFNDELQIYTGPYFESHAGDFDDGNYRLNPDGTLSLIARKTVNPEVLAWNQGGYSSGMITTRGLEPWLGGPTHQFAFQYGYVEARIDPSEEPGAWNAFWMLPAAAKDGGWAYAEVDIVEKIGQEQFAWQAVHGVVGQGQYANNVPSTPGFHTYGLNWTPQTMTWYIDGQQTFQIATPSDMHQPMVLIANLAVGGSWAGTPDFGPDGQAEMVLDYIRVFEIPGMSQIAPKPDLLALLQAGDESEGEDEGEVEDLPGLPPVTPVEPGLPDLPIFPDLTLLGGIDLSVWGFGPYGYVTF